MSVIECMDDTKASLAELNSMIDECNTMRSKIAEINENLARLDRS